MENRIIETTHLLRRAGFGASEAEIQPFAKLSHRQAVAQLLAVDPVQIVRQFEVAAQVLPNDLPVSRWGQEELQQAWLQIMLQTPHPLVEKLALFFHGHFTSSVYKVEDPRLMLQQVAYLRRNVLGNFGQMVRDLAVDPAMLIYLDGVDNTKDNPNENFARELMELFTIGLGNYTEQDVREAARAFTGWQLEQLNDSTNEPVQYRVFYTSENHDNGLKTFMGQVGLFEQDDILKIILKRREVAYFIARKLWEFLAYPTPANALVKRLGDQFFDSNYDLRKLVEAIFLSPEFLSAQAYRALVKSPVELVVGTLRTLGGSVMDGSPLYLMGQLLFAPPNVKGWPGGRQWLNSASYLARVNFAQDLLEQNIGDPGLLKLLSAKLNFPNLNPTTLFNELTQLLVDKRALGLEEVKSFISMPYESDPSDQESRYQEFLARWHGAVHLILACPEYQLA